MPSRFLTCPHSSLGNALSLVLRIQHQELTGIWYSWWYVRINTMSEGDVKKTSESGFLTFSEKMVPYNFILLGSLLQQYSKCEFFFRNLAFLLLGRSGPRCEEKMTAYHDLFLSDTVQNLIIKQIRELTKINIRICMVTRPHPFLLASSGMQLYLKTFKWPIMYRITDIAYWWTKNSHNEIHNFIQASPALSPGKLTVAIYF